MPKGDEYSEYDALAWFHTGAVSAGAAQPDPDASLGGFYSSSRAPGIGLKVRGGIRGLEVVRWGSAHVPGIGILAAVSDDELIYRPPGGQFGNRFAVANGETKQIQGAADHENYLVVSRSSANPLTGTASLIYANEFNNAFGMENVSSAEAAAGEEKLRALALWNLSSVDVDDVGVWVSPVVEEAQPSDADQLPSSGAGTIGTRGSFSGWDSAGYCRIETSGGSLRETVYYGSRTDSVLNVAADGRGKLGTSASAGSASDVLYNVPGIRIAVESESGGQYTVAANENDATVIGSMIWSQPIRQTAALSIGTLVAESGRYGVWLRLSIQAGSVAMAAVRNPLRYGFTW